MSRPQASILILLGLVLALFVFVPEVPLLGFAGLLLAAALSLPAGVLMRWTGLPRGVAVLIVLLALVGLAVAAGALAAGPLAAQAHQLAEDLPRSFETLRDRVSDSDWGSWISERLHMPDGGASQGMSFLASATNTTLGWIGNAVVVLLVGVYLARVRRSTSRGCAPCCIPHSTRRRPRRWRNAASCCGAGWRARPSRWWSQAA